MGQGSLYYGPKQCTCIKGLPSKITIYLCNLSNMNVSARTWGPDSLTKLTTIFPVTWNEATINCLDIICRV